MVKINKTEYFNIILSQCDNNIVLNIYKFWYLHVTFPIKAKARLLRKPIKRAFFLTNFQILLLRSRNHLQKGLH